MAIDPDFAARLRGNGLLTTEILYFMPDHRHLLQSFSWQTMDLAPQFPRLNAFIDHWRREVQAVIHSITIAHTSGLAPATLRSIDGQWRLN